MPEEMVTELVDPALVMPKSPLLHIQLGTKLRGSVMPESAQPRPQKTKIFYDCEFIEDGHTVDLISIGMVDPRSGREYYAVNANAPWSRIRERSWLVENVLSSLPAYIPLPHEPAYDLIGGAWSIDYADPAVKPHPQIAREVAAFILDGPSPELWAWYGAYDHVVLCQLWGAMIDLPAGVPMWTNDIRQEQARLLYRDQDMPLQSDGLHNALEDARFNVVRARHLGIVA